MTVLEQIKMEQRVQELENRVVQLEEVVQAMGRLMLTDQSAQQQATVPNDITIQHHADAVLYLKELGYTVVGGGVYISPDKTIRAQVILNKNFQYDVKFSRV